MSRKAVTTLTDLQSAFTVAHLYQNQWLPSTSAQAGFFHSDAFNDKVGVWQGDITKLQLDAIVNAANRSLLGGGGVDGAIHSAAGSKLVAACRPLNGCDTGDAKITAGFDLPAKHVIHTVGPVYNDEEDDADLLRSCYQRSLEVAVENDCKSLAFNCISTGIYGYPNRDAAAIALDTTRKFLESSDGSSIDFVLFCIFLEKDVKVYKDLVPLYFPPADDSEAAQEKQASAEPAEEGQRMFKGSDGLPVIVSGKVADDEGTPAASIKTML